MIDKQEKINLAGKWSFQMDSSNVGISKRWFEKRLIEQLSLPGSMTLNNKGYEITVSTPWTGSLFDSLYFVKQEYAKYRRKAI